MQLSWMIKDYMLGWRICPTCNSTWCL